MDKWIVINTAVLVLLSILALTKVLYLKRIEPSQRYRFTPYFYWLSTALLIGLLIALAEACAQENSGQIVINPKNIAIPLGVLFASLMRIKACKNCGAVANRWFSNKILYCYECGSKLSEK